MNITSMPAIDRESVTVPLVEAVQSVWHAIRRRHPEVPPVVITIGKGARTHSTKLGHFAAQRWVHDEMAMHELFVGGEGLVDGEVTLLGTLLHEATHALANVRGIQDTSRQARYHNGRFRTIGEELGLSLTWTKELGWSTTSVPAATERRYATELSTLAVALTAYRRPEPSDSKRYNGQALACACPRKIRASRKVILQGPILCPLCGRQFVPI